MVKCYMKKHFTCGICTTSRIESKHRVYKQFLNGNISLVELFRTFNKLELVSITQYKEEIKRFTFKQDANLSEYALIREVTKLYGKYVIQKVKERILECLHYEVKSSKNNNW